MKTSLTSAAAIMVLAALGPSALAIACNSGTHPFVAQAYDDVNDCLGPAYAVDVLDGAESPTCAAACVTGLDSAGTVKAFVTTLCAPFPPSFAVSGPECAAALAALNDRRFCDQDGGFDAGPRDASISDANLSDASDAAASDASAGH